MPITYNLAPVPRWFFTDQFGKPLSGGFLFSYRDLNRSQFKPIYQDINGFFPYPDPIIFDLNGMAPGIFYFASDEYYYLEIYDASNVLQFTVEMYNAPGFGMPTPPVPTNPFPTNLVRNPQFTWWSTSKSWPNYKTAVNVISDYVSDDWTFSRSNLNATINLTANLFLPGQTDVPDNPVYNFDYECTSAGAGSETFKSLLQYYKSVQTLAGQTVTISFYARTRTTGSVSVEFHQLFGAGGSALVSTLVGSVPSLTSIWTLYTFTVTIPNINGKIIGPGGDDYLFLVFNYPLNQPATVGLANIYLQTGSTASPFPYLTPDEQQKHSDYNVTESLWYTGDIKPTFRAVSDPGWLLLGALASIGNSGASTTYAGGFTKRLYELLWNNVADAFCPVAGGRGASAEADFNALKGLTLPQTQNRVLSQQNGGTHPLGFFTGEDTHILTIPEIPAHSHGFAYLTSPPTVHVDSGDNFPGGQPIVQTTLTGGDQPHNNLQPTIYVNYMIKL